MEKPVIIFGASGIGIAALEIFKSNEIVVYGFLDDDKDLHNTEIEDIKVLGSLDEEKFSGLIGKKCSAFVAVDENVVRKKIVEILKKERKVMPVNAIHKSAIIGSSTYLGHGNLINQGVVLGGRAKISNHCILNSNAIIEHEAVLGDFVQVGAGSIINSGVKISDEAFIGSGATVVSGIKIGKGAQVGAGSVVVKDVADGETVFGNPASPVKI